MPKVVLGILAVVIALACWWCWSQQTPMTPVPASNQAPPASQPAAPEPANAAVPNAATNVAPASDPTMNGGDRTAAVPADYTWVVRGRVVKAHQVPYPQAQIRVQCFAGADASGTPLHERAITADAEGRFDWPLPVPSTTVTLLGQGTMPRHTAEKEIVVVPKGDAPPPEFVVWVAPLDRIVTGTVLDAEKQPIAGAWVGSLRNKQPVNADGTFRIEQASGYGTTMLQAGAHGFTTIRQTLAVSDQPELTAHFTLEPGFRIAGRVTDEQDRPIAGASVATFYTLWEPASTGADGRYEITQADPARDSHSLFARKPGYLEARTEVDGKNPKPTYDLVLRKGARVGGRVFDPKGAPIAGAELYIGRSPNAYNRLDATSRDDGTFEFPAVETGAQTMVTSKQGLAPDTRVIEVPKDQNELAIDVHLQRAHFVAGVVVDGTGRGLGGVSVSALVKKPEGAAHRNQRGDYIDVRNTTAADGSFRLDGLPPGVVNLEAYSNRIVRHMEQDVAVDRSDVRLVVKQAAQFAGRVVDDTTGQPVREFRVHFVEPVLAAGEPRFGGYSTTWSQEGHSFHDDEGIFHTEHAEFEVGAVGGIEVSAKGYAPTRNQHVTAAVDPDPDACVVRLQRGGTIAGKVVSAADGLPIAGARLEHFDSVRPLPLYDDEFGGRLRTTTAADGTFTLENVPAGEASLQVVAVGLPPHRDGPIPIQPGATVQRLVQVPAGAALAGVLLDPDRNPLPGARVVVRAADDRNSVDLTSDAEGRFRTTTPLAPGDYAITAQASRDHIAFALYQRVTLIAGQTLEVEVQPGGRGVLHGTVIGDAAAGTTFRLHAWLLAAGGKPNPYFQAPCAAGQFELRGLPAGEYQLTVHQEPGGISGNASGHARCTISETEPTEIEVKVTTNDRGR